MDARSEVIAKVKAALRIDNYQLSFPTLDDFAAEPLPSTDGRRRLGDFQRFHRVLDQEKGFIADLFLNYICLTEEIGEIGKELKHVWVRRERMLTHVGNREEAYDRALDTVKDSLQEELADALAYLLKIANDTGIDLETAYLKKMGKNWTRSWPE
jgi:NTP pyrophosphatase (non-canonical NTP hydrolase)